MTADLRTLLTRPAGQRPALALPDGLRDCAWFRSASLGLAARLVQSGAGTCLLAVEDAGHMAIAFTAAARAGCGILLPASMAPDHLAALAARTDAVISDQAALPGLSPLCGMDTAPLGTATLDLDGVIVTIHSSGSTGAPVALPRPLSVLAAEVEALEATFAPAGGDVLGSVPPYHIYGLLHRVLWPLAAGRTVVAGMIRYPNDLADAAARHPGAIFVSSPAFLRRAVPLLDPAVLGDGLSLLLSSGGPLDPEVAAQWNRAAAAPLVEVYGSTETGGIAHRRVLDETAPPPWRPFPGIRVRRDEETGRLMLRSPYLDPQEEVQGGDRIGEVLPDGSFTLLGRADRIVKIEESRVSLDEVEAALRGTGGFEHVRVFPLTRGERTALAAVLAPTDAGWEALHKLGRREVIADLTERLRQQLPGAAVPRAWRFVRALPENAQGKTTQEALAALFAPQAGRLVQPDMLAAGSDGDAVVLTLGARPDLCFFDGHFDGAPILPGVVQVDWAVREARSRFGIDLPFLRLEAVKFFKVAPAGTELQLALSRKPGTDTVGFTYTSLSGQHSSGRIVFGHPAETAA